VLDDVGSVQAIYTVSSSYTHLSLNYLVTNILRDNVSCSEFFNAANWFKNAIIFDIVREKVCIDELHHRLGVLVALGMEIKELVNEFVLRD
jgi:hypothetical protein